MSKKFIGLALLCGALALHSGFLQAVKLSDRTKKAQADAAKAKEAAVRVITFDDLCDEVPDGGTTALGNDDPKRPGAIINVVNSNKPDLGIQVGMIIRDYDLDESPYVYTIYQANGKTLFARITADEGTKERIRTTRADQAAARAAAAAPARGGAGAPSRRSSRTGSVSSVDETPAPPASRGRSSTPVPSAPPALTPPVMASAVASTTDPEARRSSTPTPVRKGSSSTPKPSTPPMLSPAAGSGDLISSLLDPEAIAAAPAPSTSPALTPAPAARAIAAPPAIARAAAPAPAPSAPPAAAYSAYRLPTVKRSDLIAGTTVTPGKLPSSGSITTNTYTITKITNDKLKTQGVQEGMFSLDKDFSSANYLYSEYAGGTRSKAVEIVDDAASSRRRVAPPAAGGAGELPVL